MSRRETACGYVLRSWIRTQHPPLGSSWPMVSHRWLPRLSHSAARPLCPPSPRLGVRMARAERDDETGEGCYGGYVSRIFGWRLAADGPASAAEIGGFASPQIVQV